PWLIASINRLSSGCPGTTAGPLRPPARAAARESSRSPPLTFAGPWHSWHRAASRGRTSFSKNSTPAASGSSPRGPAATRPSSAGAPPATRSLVSQARLIGGPPGGFRRANPPLLSLLHVEQLDVEDQDRVRPDRAARAGVGPVGQLGGDEQLPLRAGLHEL